MKKLAAGGALILALAFGVSACGAPPTPAGSGQPSSTYKACLVSDTGGFSDKSFNEAAKKGVDQAVTELSLPKAIEIESKAEADYATNIASLVKENCSLVIGVGYTLTSAIVDAAQKNPNSHFAIIDDNPANLDPPVVLPNLKAIVFKTSDAGYLAGYAAAGYSKTGIVATFGGVKLPTVTIFMDGFADGVAKYNADNGKSVKLLGWDKAAESGSFADSFIDTAKGLTLAQQFIDQGADVIMPVAGNVGNGAVGPAREKGAALVWVDQDGYISTQAGDLMLTSVMKGIQPAVYNTIKQEVQTGTFDAKPYIGTLANDGVGIAPWHDFDSKLTPELKAQVDALKAQIVAGTLKVVSKSDPVVG